MPKRIMTDALYAEMVRELRQNQNFSEVAKKLGCGERFVSRAYNDGWLRRPKFIPIKQVLEQEVLEASARYQRLDESTQEQRAKIYELARQQAINARVEEHALVGVARTAASILLQQSLDLIRAQNPVTEKLVKLLQALAEKDVDELDASTLLKLQDKITHNLDTSVKAMHRIIDANRLLRENPEEGGDDASGETMSDDEIEEELRQVEHTRRHLKKGLCVVSEEPPA